MNEQAITSRFRAHDCAENSASENKRWIVPHILRARAPRQVGTLQNYKPGDWTEGDVLVEDLEVYANWQWACNLFNDPDERPGTWTWRNLFVTTQLDPYYGGMKWALRAYNMPECVFEDCDFFAIPRSHALYISNYEGSTVDRCTFLRIASQGVQFAHRPTDKEDDTDANTGANNRPYASKPVHVLRDSHFVDCADGGRRTSFNATYFNGGSSQFPGSLFVDNCSFVAQFPEPFGHFKSRSTGALVVTPWSQLEPGRTNHMEKVHIKNTLMDFTAGDRQMAVLRHIDEIVLEDCTFIARDHRMGTIDIDSPSSHIPVSGKTRRIIVRNCIAKDVELRIYPRGVEDYRQTVRIDLNTLGKEVVIDGETGAVISETRWQPESDEARLKSIKEDLQGYFGRE